MADATERCDGALLTDIDAGELLRGVTVGDIPRGEAGDMDDRAADTTEPR